MILQRAAKPPSQTGELLWHNLSAQSTLPLCPALQLLTLGHGVWLHVPVVVFTGPNEASLGFHSLSHHIINKPMFIPDLLGFKLGFVLPKKQERRQNKRRKLVLLGTSPASLKGEGVGLGVAFVGRSSTNLGIWQMGSNPTQLFCSCETPTSLSVRVISPTLQRYEN